MKQFIGYASVTISSMLLGWAMFLGVASVVLRENQFMLTSSMYSFTTLVVAGSAWAVYLTWKS